MKKIKTFLFLIPFALLCVDCTNEPIVEIDNFESPQYDTAVSNDIVEISLSWYGNEDMDLHIIEPNGKHLYFAETSSAIGGELTYSDPKCNDGRQFHTESLSYNHNVVMSGKYEVYVDLYGTCGGQSTEWALAISVNGEVTYYTDTIDMVTGSNLLDPSIEPFEFTIR